MPYTNTWKSDNLLRKFHGEVSAVEILQSNFDMQAHPGFAAIKYIINDFTTATSHEIDTNHTKIYALTDDIISVTKGKFKIAIVVIQNEHVVLAESYRKEMKNKVFECEIFKTVEEAQTWSKSEES